MYVFFVCQNWHAAPPSSDLAMTSFPVNNNTAINTKQCTIDVGLMAVRRSGEESLRGVFRINQILFIYVPANCDSSKHRNGQSDPVWPNRIPPPTLRVRVQDPQRFGSTIPPFRNSGPSEFRADTPKHCLALELGFVWVTVSYLLQ